jgi:hypothetical protein
MITALLLKEQIGFGSQPYINLAGVDFASVALDEEP